MISSVKDKYDNQEKAIEVLSSANFMPATTLVIAADILSDGNCFAWELETVFDHLEDRNCLPKPKARDRLMASMSILLNPAFLWDAGAFMAVAQTFNGALAVPEIWEPLTPGSIAYALDEISAVYRVYNNTKRLDPLYGEEPKIFMAACCKEHGFSTLPPQLELCRDQYNRVYELPEDVQDLVANPVLDRKLKEITTYLEMLTKLRANLVAELKK